MVRFIYTSEIPRAPAKNLPDPFNPDRVNIPRYSKLLGRAIDTVLEPIMQMEKMGLNEDQQLKMDL